MLISDFPVLDCFHRNCQWGNAPKSGKSESPANPEHPLDKYSTTFCIYFQASSLMATLQRSKGNTPMCIFRSVKKHLNCVPWSLKHNSSFLSKQPKHQPAFPHNS